MASTYNDLNTAYYGSAYNKQLGSQGKAKGFWDWTQDPNRENFDASDYGNAQNYVNSSRINPTPIAPTSFVPNTKGPETYRNTIAENGYPNQPIQGQASLTPTNNTTPNIAAPIAGTTTMPGIPAQPVAAPPIGGNNNIQSLPSTGGGLAPMDRSQLPTAKRRLSAFGALV